jgi:hypothetical protein
LDNNTSIEPDLRDFGELARAPNPGFFTRQPGNHIFFSKLSNLELYQKDLGEDESSNSKIRARRTVFSGTCNFGALLSLDFGKLVLVDFPERGPNGKGTEREKRRIGKKRLFLSATTSAHFLNR